MHSVKWLWIAVITLGLALLWTEFKSGTETSPAPAISKTEPPDNNLLQRIQVLESELTQELLQRQALERRLARLEQQKPVIMIQGETEPTAEPATIPDETGQSENNPPESDQASLEDKLISAGLASETIQSIQHRLDQNRLEMLQLRDSAIREGWNESEEFTERMHEMSDPTRGLREEFGDQVYDEYLYASGRANRIRIREVYSGSAAASAGLQVDDIITGYADRRIFSMTELRQATVEGVAGENVLVELVRNGMPISTTITRGPMGISMSTTRVEP